MLVARTTIVALFLVALAAAALEAQEPRVYEDNGIRYQEFTSETQRPMTSVRYEPRESTVYRPRYSTNMQESVRTYQVPVTEQQWVLGYQRTWNIFAPPVPSYRLMPVTRWETRSETVRVPITKCEYLPERVVQQVPITDTRIAKETVVRRVAIGVTGDAPAVARKDAFGDTPAADGDPPAETSFNSSSPIDRRK